MNAGILKGQLDYILFFYGLALVLLCAVSLCLSRCQRQMSWAWLASFGLITGSRVVRAPCLESRDNRPLPCVGSA